MFGLGPSEMVLIAVVALIIFGPKRLPELGKGIGQFIQNFKKGVSGQSGQDDSKDSENKDKEPKV